MEADGPPTINIKGGVMQFDDTNYIRQDQIPAIVSQASKQGEARACADDVTLNTSQGRSPLMEYAIGHFLDLNLGGSPLFSGRTSISRKRR